MSDSELIMTEFDELPEGYKLQCQEEAVQKFKENRPIQAFLTTKKNELDKRNNPDGSKELDWSASHALCQHCWNVVQDTGWYHYDPGEKMYVCAKRTLLEAATR